MCQTRHEIFVTNLKDNDVIEHELLLVKGFIHKKCSISGIGVTAGGVSAAKEFEVSTSGAFRALWLLGEGENRLEFNYCTKSLTVRLTHRKSESTYKIQPLYIVCKNHDGRFTSVSKQNAAEDGCRIISLGLKLVQCLYAEKLQEATSVRKTFSLQSDCVQFNAKLDVKRARELDEHALWNELAYEIINSALGANDRLKFVAFIGCTLYEGISDGDYSYANIKRHTKAHAALGGGGLALFGSAGLYTWPTSVDEIVPCFRSATEIDQKHFWDESNYRHTFGGCFATTLGAVCHEIGHIFDLGHTKDGIMGNGFDYVNRVFTVNTLVDILPDRQVETGLLPSKQQQHKDKRLTQLKKPSKFLEKYHEQKSCDGTFFTRSCALILHYHKWLNRYQPETASCIRLDRSTHSITSDPADLAVVEIREKSNGLVVEFLDLSQRRQKQVRLKAAVDYRAFDVFAMTSDGSTRLFD